MGAFFVGHYGWSTRLVRWEKGAGHYNLKLSLIPGCGNKVPRCCGIVFSRSNARIRYAHPSGRPVDVTSLRFVPTGGRL